MPGAPIDLGPDIHEGNVERAVRDALKRWMPWALQVVDAHHGTGPTAPPRTYQAASDDTDRWVERKPPALVVSCPGTAADPKITGRRGSYAAWWQINVAITAGGATATGTRAIAERQAAAARRVLLHQTAGELIEDVLWLGTRIAPAGDKRTVMAAEVLAIVYVPRVIDTRGSFPRTPPPPDAAAATHPAVVDRRSSVSTQPPPETP